MKNREQLLFARPAITAAFALIVFLFSAVAARADTCEICGADIEDTVYFWKDKVTSVKKRICPKCTSLPTSCYMCSLPVVKNYTELPDGRILCERDAKTAVISDSDAVRICEDTRRELERQFSRFMSFPDRNVSIALVDRVNLINLFQIPGRDYECPNVLGYLFTRTNKNPVIHELSLLSGLPAETLRTTYAHELTHAWVAENVPAARRKRLNRNAEEGFCELIAYLLADARGDEAGKQQIKLNAYTRGQFGAFLAAHERFGINDVIDWMQRGEDALIQTDDLTRVRRIEVTTATNSFAPIVFPGVATVPAAAPETLALKGILWSARPSAIINDRTFTVNEENRMKLGTNTVAVRCLLIQPDAVVIQVAGSSSTQTLSLRK